MGVQTCTMPTASCACAKFTDSQPEDQRAKVERRTCAGAIDGQLVACIAPLAASDSVALRGQHSGVVVEV